MRRKTTLLGILLGVASLSVVSAAALVLPTALGADTEALDVDWIAAPAPCDRIDPCETIAPRRGARPATLRDGTFDSPGYRRVSRKRVQPKKKSADALICLSKLVSRVSFGRFTAVKLNWTNAAPLNIRFDGEERIKAAAELRKLPVEDRLARAAEELSLTPGQIELLQRAAAEREASAKNGADGVTTFDRRVAEALNDDQRRRWKDDGYGDSFGAGQQVIFVRSQLKAASIVAAGESVVLDTQATAPVLEVERNVSVTLGNWVRDGEDR